VRDIEINNEPIELYKLLKVAGVFLSGGEAKFAISEGEVSVNGEVETRKRKKILSGDKVSVDSETIRVKLVTKE
jgi:ribosome-associated protein